MTRPTEVKLPESLEVVAWAYYDGERENFPSGPHATLLRSTALSFERHPHYRNETALVRLSDAESALKARDAEIERLTKERDDARRAKTAHFSPAYLLSNARRIAAPEYATMSNWALATHLFAVGSTTANTICRENGIDPDAKTVHPGAAIDQARAEGGEDGKSR